MSSGLIQGPPHQKIIKFLFSLFGISPVQTKKYQRLLDNLKASEADFLILKKRFEILEKISPEKAPFFVKHFKDSSSQFYQDLFFASELASYKEGFFVEIGACDGVTLSNSIFFEKFLKWQGIIVEPAKKWHPYLSKNRSAFIEKRAIGSVSGKILPFFEAEDPKLSTFTFLKNSDFQAEFRNKGKEYEVETVSLNDLLDTYKAPKEIHYLSLDTEGSEYTILQSFDFNSRKILSISCEHNFTPNRQMIFDLLTAQGYKRKFEDFSVCDDWYFLQSNLK